MSGTVIIVGPTPSTIPFFTEKTGITLLNQTANTVTLSTSPNFLSTTTFKLTGHSSLPIATGPLYAKASTQTQIVVLRGLLNITSPTHVTFKTATVKITGPVTVQGTATVPPATVKVTNTVNVLVDPTVKTVGVFTGRAALLGTTTAVVLIPTTRTPTYWENMKIGWAVWSTSANTGTWIYIGDSSGGTPTGWSRIPSGKTKLMGSFSVAWGNAWVARVAGKNGDHVNVWAA